MAQQFLPPNRGGSSDDRLGSDYDEPLMPTSVNDQSAQASAGAANTLSNIDDALNDNGPESAEALASREGQSSPDGKGAGAASKAAGLAALAAAEAGAEDGQLGAGFNPGSSGGARQRLKARFPGTSSKVRVFSLLSAGGVTVGFGLVGFLALLPLKLNSIMSNLESHYFASSEGALDKMVQKDFSGYVTKYLIPGLNSATCTRGYVTKSCIAPISGNSPIAKMYEGWRQSNLEGKLQTNYGLEFAKKGNVYYMSAPSFGTVSLGSDLHAIEGSDIFQYGKPASRAEIRAAIKDSLKGASLYDRAYFHFVLGPYLDKKYAIRRCVIACNVQDKFNDKKITVADKKLAAKLMITQRVFEPLSSDYALLLQCVLAINQCDTKLTGTDSADGERISPVNQQLEEQLQAYIAEHGAEGLTDLLSKADDLKRLGLSGYIAKQVSVKVAQKLGGDAASAATAEAADKSVPIIGWLSLAVNLLQTEQSIGPTVKYLAYSMHKAAAVQEYMAFRTVADETKSSHVDAAELGGFSDQFSSAADASDPTDMTQTPLYASINSSPITTPTTALLNGLGARAYADPASATPYLCNDGNPVPAGKTVCSEDDLTNAGPLVNFATSSFTRDLLNIQNANSQAVFILGDIYNAVSGFISNAALAVLTKTCDITTGGSCTNVETWVASWGLKFTGWLFNEGVPNAFARPGGGNTYVTTAMGADAVNASASQSTLGGRALSPTESATILNEQQQSDKQSFESKPYFARLFSSSTPYSLVSRLALMLPTSTVSAADNGIASIFSNPLGKIGAAFSTIFSSDKAFAGSIPQADPFGIPQAGYTDSDINKIGDPQAYWDTHCADGTQTTAWDNSGTLNTDTGEPIYTTTDPCQLINASARSGGSLFDNSLAQGN